MDLMNLFFQKYLKVNSFQFLFYEEYEEVNYYYCKNQ